MYDEYEDSYYYNESYNNVGCCIKDYASYKNNGSRLTTTFDYSIDYEKLSCTDTPNNDNTAIDFSDDGD